MDNKKWFKAQIGFTLVVTLFTLLFVLLLVLIPIILH